MSFRLLLLVRHADSEKNELGQFAGNEASDRLTAAGEQQLRRLTDEIELLIKELGIKSTGIAHADSGRARTTADALRLFSSDTPIATSGFRSIRSGVASGLRETEIAKIYPNFACSLQLYREGVLSSYNIPYPSGAEPVIDFESEVRHALHSILSGANRELQIIVGHRSSITALLLHYARLAHSYPPTFFGFIPLSACLTSCIDIRPGRECILWVNRVLTPDSIAQASTRQD